MSMNKTFVSIIVPVYGTEAYLSDCINSLCNQSHSCIEIILVDDQSPDRCPEICDSYAQLDSRIKVIHQNNKGVSGARNTGINAATGEYIMFVDSDDELYPYAVETLLRDCIAYNADIVSATSKNIDEKGNIVFQHDDSVSTVFREDESLLLSLRGDRNTDAVWAKLFKMDFIKGIFFEEGKNINEDGFFMFQCYIRKPILLQHNISVYRYNIRKDSCSRQFFSEKYLSMLYFMNCKKKCIISHYPQYIDEMRNMEVRTLLYFLDVLCRDRGSKNKKIQVQCIQTIRKLYKYHQPINKHHKQLAWIAVNGLYPLYKILISLKYYR